MNLRNIHDIFKKYETKEHELKIGLTDESSNQRKILTQCCNDLDLPISDTGLMLAYKVLAGGDIESYLAYYDSSLSKKHDFSEYEKAYNIRTNYVMQLQKDFINELIDSKELSDFYASLLLNIQGIGESMNELYKAWKKQTIYIINEKLEEDFDNNTTNIIHFLKENKLLDIDHRGNIADMSYSVLFHENGVYVTKTYSQAFPEISKDIVNKISKTIQEIESLDDPDFHQKSVYKLYFEKLKEVFEEIDTNKFYNKYYELELAWMDIKGPFQIAHSFEYYEDLYRKSVSIEFDLRIDDLDMLETRAKEDIKYLYDNIKESINDEAGLYRSIFNNTEKVLEATSLHIGNAPLVYASRTTSAYSAQVIPNNEAISKTHGKKIFALPESVLSSQRNAPFMKIDSEFLDTEFLDEYRRYIFGDPDIYNRIYDISTIGHEFGHILWCDEGTEVEMNESGQFKNIEEWKATSSGLLAYFLSDKQDMETSQKLIMSNLYRAIKLLRYNKLDEIIPYYAEAILHLEVYKESNMLVIENGKAVCNFHGDVFEELQKEYMKMYTFLVDTYLHKKDASSFLDNYTTRDSQGYIMPKDKELKTFTQNYQKAYIERGNEIDTTKVAEDYLF